MARGGWTTGNGPPAGSGVKPRPCRLLHGHHGSWCGFAYILRTNRAKECRMAALLLTPQAGGKPCCS
nr:MAG TPA: hypothetical protein [Caudoviricetes sp.]